MSRGAPPPLPARSPALLAAAALGAAVPFGLLAAWRHGQGGLAAAPPAALLLGGAAGALLLGPAPHAAGRARRIWTVGLALAALLAAPLLPAALGAAAALAGLGIALGALLRRAGGGRATVAGATLASAAALAAVVARHVALPAAPCAALALAVGGAFAARAGQGAGSSSSLARALGVALVSARLVATTVVAAGGLVFLDAAPGRPPPAAPESDAALAALAATAAGLAAGLALGGLSPALRSPRLLALLEPLGWGCLLGLAAAGAPRALGDEGALALTLAALAGALGGAALATCLRGAAALGLGLGALGLPLGGALFAAGAAAWPLPERLALALGSGAPPDARLRAAAEEERVRLRFARYGPPSVAVVDVRSGEETARLLTVDGRVLGATPVRADAPPQLVAGQVLQGALPALLAPEPPARVAQVGLGTGVACGTALRSRALEALTLSEPLAGVLAVHADPGDPFGFVSGRPLEDPRLELRREPTPAPRAQALVVGAGPLTAARAARLGGAPLSVWRLARLEAGALDALPEDVPLHAFDAGSEELVLLVGPLELTLASLRARFAAEPALAAALRPLGIEGPEALLAHLSAAPATLARLRAGPRDAALDPAGLAASGAAEVARALVVAAGEEADSLLALARALVTRRAPAAVAVAEAALERARERVPALELLGQARAGAGDDPGAQAAWREAIALAPRALGPRLLLARRLLEARAWAEAREVLRPALRGEAQAHPAQRREVHYLLGKLALALREPHEAIAQLERAGAHADAADLLGVARALARDVPEPPRPAAALALAARLLQRARTAADAEAARRALDDAVAALTPLAHAPEPLEVAGPEEAARARVRLARLLREAAGLHDAPPAARTLQRLAADVLAPLAVDDPRRAAERAEALTAAGAPAEAEAALLEHAGSDEPAVHEALGEALLAQGKPDAAAAALRKALASGPASSTQTRTYLRLADAERAAGRLGRAIEALQTAERLLPGHPRVRLNLGTLLLEAGRKAEGLAAYRAFLAVAPANDALRERVARAVERLEAELGAGR